jgi:N-methylhydantoinase A/oxoprolinase/acetone carboxylase beta subunit
MNDRTEDERLRIGLDVGGTNTDAVVIDELNTIVHAVKRPTTADVSTGVQDALDAALTLLGDRRGSVEAVMLGTTHATNAVVERRGLDRVGAIRLGGPVAAAVPPLASWPFALREAAIAGSLEVSGGHLADGHPIAPLDEDHIRRFLDSIAGTAGAIAITGVFSPTAADQEFLVAEIVAQELGRIPISLSNQIGALGLIERENATVLNATLHSTARRIVRAFETALRERELDVQSFLAQNDGSLMTGEFAATFPVLTVGAGPSNSIRGAGLLTGIADAIVVDVGGTTTDLGVLVGGFARESSAGAEIGGVQTNFPMPDVTALGFGGGTILHPQGPGPDSVGYRVRTEALSFGGNTPTLTDAAAATGRWRSPLPHSVTSTRATESLFHAALATFDAELIERIRGYSTGGPLPAIIAVGGGAELLPEHILGQEVHRPEHAGVANAAGAAIALASGVFETVSPTRTRADAIDEASEAAIARAIAAGADPASVQVIQLSEVHLSYANEPTSRIRVKAAGELLPRQPSRLL